MFLSNHELLSATTIADQRHCVRQLFHRQHGAFRMSVWLRPVERDGRAGRSERDTHMSGEHVDTRLVG